MADFVMNTSPMNATIDPAGFSTPGLENHGYKVFMPIVILLICSGLFVVARIATRIFRDQLGADDYVIVGALVSCLIQCSLWACAVRAGYGADYEKLNWQHKKLFNKYWFLGSLFYPLTLGLFKTAVVLLNKRIFVQPMFQKLCWATIVVNTCWCIGTFLGTAFQCIPMNMMWGGSFEGSCWNQDSVWISLISWDVSTDVWITSMPLPMIWNLQLKMKEKLMLTGESSLVKETLKHGDETNDDHLLHKRVIVCSLMSCSVIITSLQAQGTAGDNNYTFALANLFQVLEANIGIIGACLPILRQPLRAVFPKIFGTMPASKRSRPYYDDRFTDEYVMQNYSDGQKEGSKRTWHDVSVKGPDVFKSSGSERKSDELGIMHNASEFDNHSSGAATIRSMEPSNTIRKNTSYTVQRV